MNKIELMGLTLDMLIAKFHDSPESFVFTGTGSYQESTHPSITWQPKIQLDDANSTVVDDPNSAGAIVITFNTTFNEMHCYVYTKTPISTYGAKADSSISVCRWFEKWRANYRKFVKLKRLILGRVKHLENVDFIKNLSSVFPDALDGHIFHDR
jgi:hypothetical protein